jgi:hypothetical protein
MLVGIRVLHTAVCLFFAGCILAIPFAGIQGRLRWAAVLAANRGRCPLTDLAGRYTEERADNFDIYLPLWLARHNKTIFGTLFVLGELILLCRWMIFRR